jgi:Cu-processing system permease protein
MKAMIAIARNTFQEAIRDRILYTFLGFAVLLIVGSRFISMITIGDQAKIIKDVGFLAVQMFGMLIAVMVSVIMVAREFEQRTIYTILSRPVSRTQYLIGKYLGMLLISGFMILLMSFVLLLIVQLFARQFDLLILFGGFMTYLEMMILSAFAVLFATLTKPILGSVLTLTTFVFGHFTGALLLLQLRLDNAIADFLIPVFYYILPNLEVFNFKTEIVHAMPIPTMSVVWAIAYALIYSTLLILLAGMQFNGKDIE